MAAPGVQVPVAATALHHAQTHVLPAVYRLVRAVAEVVLIRVLTGAEIPVPEIVKESVKAAAPLPVMQIVILRVLCSVTEVQNRKDL